MSEVVEMLRPARLHVVVLNPSAGEVKRRERGRDKVAYRSGEFTVEQLTEGLVLTTPNIGYWLDSGNMTVTESAEKILASRLAARVSGS